MVRTEELQNILEMQLCDDYGITPELLRSKENIFVTMQKHPEARKWNDRDSFLKVLSYRNKIVITCKDESMLAFCKKEYTDQKGEWFGKYEILRSLDHKLAEYGHKIGDTHHYYIPGKYWEQRYAEHVKEKPADGYTFCLLNAQDILLFRGDERFSHALSFDKNAPDEMAVAAFDCNQTYDQILSDLPRLIKGMSGVSKDSRRMWQIGVDVLPSERSKGLAVHLTHSIMKECMNKNILPFYGTSESHMNSQAVAVQSGFIPAFWELHTISINETCM